LAILQMTLDVAGATALSDPSYRLAFPQLTEEILSPKVMDLPVP